MAFLLPNSTSLLLRLPLPYFLTFYPPLFHHSSTPSPSLSGTSLLWLPPLCAHPTHPTPLSLSTTDPTSSAWLSPNLPLIFITSVRIISVVSTTFTHYSLLCRAGNKRKLKRQTPLLAAQITIFSNVGICIGFAYHNVVADGRSFNSFIKTWASLFKDPSSCSINSSLLPFYDRTVIKDSYGLHSIFLNRWSKRRSSTSMVIGVSDSDLDSAMVRATFLMCPDDMEKIKGWIVGRCKVKNMDQPPRLTPSNLTWAYVWVCLIKSHEKVNGKLTGTNPSYFGFNAGGITRLGYPVPSAYFGNCIGFARTMATQSELSGEDGIIVAADAIGNRVKDLDEAFLEGAENWISERGVFYGSDSEPHVMVSGSPKLDFYETDFGWEKARKIEEISMDNAKGKAVCFTQSRDLKGGIEVGLALPKPKMDAFTCFFTQLLPHH